MDGSIIEVDSPTTVDNSGANPFTVHFNLRTGLPLDLDSSPAAEDETGLSLLTRLMEDVELWLLMRLPDLVNGFLVSTISTCAVALDVSAFDRILRRFLLSGDG